MGPLAWDLIAALAVWCGMDPVLPPCCEPPYLAALDRLAEREQVTDTSGVSAGVLRERLDTASDWLRLEETARFGFAQRDCRAAWVACDRALVVVESHRGVGTLRPWEIDDWIADLSQRKACWGALDDATNLHRPQFYRRSQLADLRRLLAPEAWRDALLPDPIPAEFYRRIP